MRKAENIVIGILYLSVFILSILYMAKFLILKRILALTNTFVALLIIVFCIMYMIIKVHNANGYLDIDSMLLWFLTFVIYSFSISAYRGLLMLGTLIDVVTWPFLTYVVYDYSKESKLPDNLAGITKAGVFIIFFLAIFDILTHDGAAAMASYFTLAFLPLVYLFSNGIMAFLYSIIACIYMMVLSKRVGFLIIIIGSVALYAIKILISNRSGKVQKLFLFTVVLFGLALSGMVIAEIMNVSIIERMQNLGEDGGSGRIDIWNYVLMRFDQSSISDKLLGHGYHAVYYNVHPFGINRFAHNSYIEFLYDYGIIGTGLLVLFVLKLVFSMIKMIKNHAEYAPIMGYSIIAALLLSAFSYFFEQTVLIMPFCIVWGICLGSPISENHTEKIKEKCKYFRVRTSTSSGGLV